MLKIRKLAVALAMVGLGIQAHALELWETHLPGVDVGMVNGALPPPGVYGVLDSYFYSLKSYDHNGDKNGVSLSGVVEVPIILWSTGWKVWGADYGMALAQPFDYTNLEIAGYPFNNDNAHWGTYNTVLVPAILSWHLSPQWHVKSSLYVNLDTASTAPGDMKGKNGVGSGNGFWSVTPAVGVSWLNDGWNVGGELFYSFNKRNTSTDYRSGQTLQLDYTIAKTMGKWTFGAGGFIVQQITKDTGSGAAGCSAQNDCKRQRFALGPTVGYQFGGISLNLDYTKDLRTRNGLGGSIYNMRMLVPF